MMPVIPLTEAIWALFWKTSSFLINGGRHEHPVDLASRRRAASGRDRQRNCKRAGSSSRSRGRNRDSPAKACEKGANPPPAAGRRRDRGARRRILVWLGLLDGGALPGLDR